MPTLQSQIDGTLAGNTCTPTPGIYREQVSINASITLDGQSGAVEIRGSDVWTGWGATAPYTSTLTVAAMSQTPTANLADADYYDITMGRNPEQVFIDGVAQLRVTGTPTAGQFALDGSRHVILGTNPSGHTVEVTMRQSWLGINAANVKVQGVIFRHVSSAPNVARGAGGFAQNGQFFESCQFFDTHGNAVSPDSSNNVTINNCTFTRCGCFSIGGSGDTWAITNNTVSECGKGGYKWSSDNGIAGGIKVIALSNGTVSGNTIYNTGGPGLWFDISTTTTQIHDNVIHDTGQGPDPGGSCIMYEISQGTTRIYNNKLWNPAMGGGGGQWGNAGVFISSSSGVEIDHNIIYVRSDLAAGISIGQNSRGDVFNNNVHDNQIIVYGGDTSGTLSFANAHGAGIVWLWDSLGNNPYTVSANNRASNNGFWWEHASGTSASDSGANRWVWGWTGSNLINLSTVAGFAVTPGGSGSYYLTDAQELAAVASLTGGGGGTAPTDTYGATIYAAASHYWRLGTADTSTTAVDIKDSINGTGAAANLTSATSLLVSGADAARVFNGTSANVLVPHSSAVQMGDQFSMECLIKRARSFTAGSGSYEIVFSKGPGTIVWGFSDDNTLFVNQYGIGNVCHSSNAITDTNAHHVVITKTPGTGALSCKIYIDGVDRTVDVTPRAFTNSTSQLVIGSDLPGDGGWFQGTIDEASLAIGTTYSSTVVTDHYRKALVGGGTDIVRAGTPVTMALLRVGATARVGTPITISLVGTTTTIGASGSGVPKLLVEVAFSSNPIDANQVWTDITPYVQGFGLKRGRQYELDTFQPGTASITLDNQDRRFDPTYPAGPYYPNIKIGKRVRVSCGANLAAPGDFETNTTGYSLVSSTIARDTTTAKTGSASLKVTTTNTNLSGVTRDGASTSAFPINITSSADYTFSLYARRATAGSCTMRLAITWLNSSNSTVSTSTSTATLNSTGWQRFSLTATSPATAARASLSFQVSPAAGVFDFYTDGWQLERGTTVSAFTDGIFRLFDGYIDAWAASWQNQFAAHTTIAATDAFKRFSLYPLNGDYPGSVNGDGPWGYWQFSGNLDDSSTHGNGGTWLGSAPSSYGGMPFASGQSGYSSKYFGTDDLMTHGNSGWTTGGISIELWLYPLWNGNDSQVHGIWESNTALNSPHWVGLLKYSDNNLYFRVMSPGGAFQDVVVGTTLNMPANTFVHIACTASPADGMRIYFNGVLVGGPTGVGSISMPTQAPTAPRWGQSYGAFLNGYIGQAAIFSTALRADQVADRYKSQKNYFPVQSSSARIGSVLDVIGWPAGDRQLDGGAATLQVDNANESALSYLQRVSASEVGRLFMAGNGKVRFIGRDATFVSPYTDVQTTFGDNAAAGERPYVDVVLTFDDTRVWNEVRLQRKGGQLAVERDTALQTTDIVRTYSDTNLLHSNDAQTRAAAQYRLSQYKQAVLRVEQLAVMPMRDPDHLWGQVLQREIGDRVMVVRRPQNLGTISQQVYIEGVEHSATAKSGGVDWTTRYSLSLADVSTFWLLGDAVRGILGSTTTLSF
jgi:hypothetical protein